MVWSAFVHNGTAVTDGTAFVRHGLCFVPRKSFVHAVTLVARSGFVHGLHSLGRCFMNSRSCLMAGTLSLHGGFHLMAGGAFPCFRTDLPGLGRSFAAAVRADCRCFGYAHYERGA